MPASNPIQQLVSSTKRLEDNSSYLILLQHSLHQRHVMASETKDSFIYKRAGVRTPAENAQRDFTGVSWLQLLAKEFHASGKDLVWVQTTDTVPIDLLSNTTVVNASSNPFGWDDNEPDCTSLEDLQSLANVIQNQIGRQQKRPVVIVESLTPILIRHGLIHACVWLRRLLRDCRTTIVVPILVESLESTQHQALEDMAQAVLFLRGGEMIMIRHGVREPGNVVRGTIDFAVNSGKDGALSIEVLSGDISLTEQQAVTTTATIPETEEDRRVISDRPGKVTVELRLEEEDGSLQQEETRSRPHIFIQDNDPEFVDLDEEDPDDDLDI